MLCVFAHPDDEAFGPGGTIALLAQKGEVEIICITDGGGNDDDKELAKTRQEEFRKSTEILGVKKISWWGYHDGSLNNRVYHELAGKLDKYIKFFKPEVLVTFNLTGVSGHLDHIAVALITSYVFERNDIPKEVWYYGISEKERKLIGEYFIYFPPGWEREDADLKFDITKVWEIWWKAVQAHQSQKKDIDKLTEIWRKIDRKEEWFKVIRRG